MPLVLRPGISPAAAAVACAHGALAGYMRWHAEPDTIAWVGGVFRKKIYQAPDLATWQAVQRWDGALVLTESALDNLTVVAVFRPRVLSPADLFYELPLYGRGP